MTSCKFLPNFLSKLSVTNLEYQKYLIDLKNLYISFDKSNVGIVEDFNVSAEIILKNDLVTLSGLEELNFLFSDLFKIDFSYRDGDVVNRSTILKINGKLADILNYERFILDLITQMSAVSTCTSKFIDILKNSTVRIAATRKSLLSPVLKKAVSVAGGLTHRLNLEHALIIKDTFKSKSIEAIFNDCLQLNLSGLDFVEFEVESISELKVVTGLLDQHKLPVNIGIMLDNFSVDMIKTALNVIVNSNLNIFIEVSGNITIDNINHFALEGIDFISTSSLFKPTNYPDFSLELLKK